MREPNPVLIREWRVRMRGRRTRWFILAWLLWLSGAALQAYSGWLPGAGAGSDVPTELTAHLISRSLFQTLISIQLLGAVLLAPILTAGSVTEEVERGGYEHLILSGLSGSEYVLGRFAGALGVFVLLVLLSSPVLGLVFFFGSVSPEQLLAASLLIVSFGVLALGCGSLASSLFRTSPAAIIGAYAIQAAFFLLLWASRFPLAAAFPADTADWTPFHDLMSPMEAVGSGEVAVYLLAAPALPVWVICVTLMLSAVLAVSVARDRIPQWDGCGTARSQLLTTLWGLWLWVGFVGPPIHTLSWRLPLPEEAADLVLIPIGACLCCVGAAVGMLPPFTEPAAPGSGHFLTRAFGFGLVGILSAGAITSVTCVLEHPLGADWSQRWVFPAVLASSGLAILCRMTRGVIRSRGNPIVALQQTAKPSDRSARP